MQKSDVWSLGAVIYYLYSMNGNKFSWNKLNNPK